MTNVTERFDFLMMRFVLILLSLMTCSAVAFSQTALPGKYEGVAKTAGAADIPITLELKDNAGKIGGSLMSGQNHMEISEATLMEGKLTVRLGAEAKDGVLNAKVDGDKIVGEWTAGTQKRAVELTRVAAVAAAASVNLSGQWDAVADANGQPFPFLLTLKVDGENVSGNSSSQLGESPIKTGTWKDGRLNFQVESQNGVISMSASIVDGKLSGEFDFSGQLQGRWVAVKKN
jgi:hypothetical protein